MMSLKIRRSQLLDCAPICEKIAEYSDALDLSSLAGVSKHWNQVSLTDRLWKNIFENGLNVAVKIYKDSSGNERLFNFKNRSDEEMRDQAGVLDWQPRVSKHRRPHKRENEVVSVPENVKDVCTKTFREQVLKALRVIHVPVKLGGFALEDHRNKLLLEREAIVQYRNDMKAYNEWASGYDVRVKETEKKKISFGTVLLISAVACSIIHYVAGYCDSSSLFGRLYSDPIAKLVTGIAVFAFGVFFWGLYNEGIDDEIMSMHKSKPYFHPFYLKFVYDGCKRPLPLGQ